MFKYLKVAFWSFLLIGSLSGGALAAIYHNALEDLPDVSELKHVSFEIPMQIYTSDNKLIGEFGEKRRIPVEFNEIPDKLKQAFLAIEDSRFYEHTGIDPIGILRAVIVAITNAQATQGASTITQQVARNFFLSREKTIERKVKEIFIAWRMEQVLTKDEIFEIYLNKIALGHRSFGVAAAAQVYYGKELKDLTLGQMATIAGLPKAPSTLNPISNPERSKARRHLVLSRMLDLGFITKEEFDLADNEPYKTFYHQAPLDLNAQYVAEEARQFAINLLGDQAYTDGIKIYTTINSNNQEYAQQAVFHGVMAYDKRHGFKGVKENLINVKGFNESKDFLIEYLNKANDFEYLKPAIVLSIDDKNKSIEIYDYDYKVKTLSWESMNFLRPFKSDSRQGNAPKRPSEIFKPFDVIYTYIDDNNQKLVGQIPEVEAALVAINPWTGGIEAMVGGFDFAKSKFNRTIQSLRQTGSNFKPFLYSAAVAKGIAINSAFMDLPIKTWDPGSQTWWEPRNSPNRFDGIMTLREALAKSKNAVSIRLIRQVGVDNFVKHLAKFDIQVPNFQQSEAMSLGSVEVTPLKLATCYSVFANGGYLLKPYLISKITEGDKVIYENNYEPIIESEENHVINDIELTYTEGYSPKENAPQQILSKGHAFIMADMLRTNIYGGDGIQGRFYGTGSRAGAYTKRQDLHGKTGTTNKTHDAWFSGFNHNIVATAWMGFDNDRNLGYSVTQGPEGGAYSALPIFAEFIKKSQQNMPEIMYKKPDEVLVRTYNGISDYVLENSYNLASGETSPEQTPTNEALENIDENNIF